MNMFNRLIATAGFALVAGQAHAMQPVSFDFTTLSGASGYTATDATTGLRITASAWSSATGTTPFSSAALTAATDGLGVCNSSEAGCLATNTLGALGNNAGYDMILFRFNTTVGLQTLTLGQFAGASSNLSMWAGTDALPATALPASLGSATSFSVAAKTSGIADVKLASTFNSNAGYDWIAVSAQLGSLNDLAKLRALTVQVNPQAMPVPEPATWMTMLAGLGLIGFAVNRRTRA